MSERHTHEHSHDHTHDHAYMHAHGIAHEHGHVHENQKAVINRLARALGHLEKVKRMVEEGHDCAEVLVQLAAVRSALDNTGKVILQDHIRHCMVDAVSAGEDGSGSGALYVYTDMNDGITEVTYTFESPTFGSFHIQFHVDGSGSCMLSIFK